MPWKVCLSDIDYGPEELARVTEVLKSKWLSMGDVTREFEARFADFLGVRHAFLVANGTAALHLANLAVGVGPEDEVIVPSLTFVATANASLYCGATPVFADIVGPHDLNVSPEDIRAKITGRTKAITVVHYGGYPADMDAICAVAREHNLKIIEDAAHAPGASWKGKMAGTIGDVGCFSFFSNKNLVTGEGGAVVTNNDDYAEQIRLMRSHGMTSLSYDRHKGHAFSYDVTCLGYNYRATEITAALAHVQLDKLLQNNARRAWLTAAYIRLLHTTGELTLPFCCHLDGSSCHLLPIVLPVRTDRRAFMSSMQRNGIQTSIHYPPVHLFEAYRKMISASDASVPFTEDVGMRQVTLPLHSCLTERDVDKVCSAVLESLKLAARGIQTSC